VEDRLTYLARLKKILNPTIESVTLKREFESITPKREFESITPKREFESI
jgi:hypothetical protein